MPLAMVVTHDPGGSPLGTIILSVLTIITIVGIVRAVVGKEKK